MICAIKKTGSPLSIVDIPFKDKKMFIDYLKTIINDTPDLELFDEKNKIGMYVSDGGYLSTDKKNFVWRNHIILGNVVFVNSIDGKTFFGLSDKQIAFIKKYLSEHNINRY